MNDQPTPTEKAREIAEKKARFDLAWIGRAIDEKFMSREAAFYLIRKELESLSTALTRSEEEKKFSIRALETLEKSIKETSSGWHKTSTELQEAQNQLSTLTARLKEAETKVETRIAQIDAELEGEEEMWETEIASQKLAGNIVKESYAKGGLSAVRAARSFLTASTPVEKKV